MNYENHAAQIGSTVLAVEDGVFTIYGDDVNDIDNWLEYFNGSDTWREVHLKDSAPFISMSNNPYLKTAYEAADMDEYQGILERARAKSHRHILIDGGEEDV